MGIRKLPRKVSYEERDGKTKSEGLVTKEAFVDEEYSWGDFHKVIQLIDMRGAEPVIRLGYYVKDHNAPKRKYTWGSQTTFMLHRKDFERLLKRAKTQGIL